MNINLKRKLKTIITMAIVFVCMINVSAVFADEEDAANIKINIASPAKDNRYFFCMPNVGCLSIQAGNQGKVYPIYRAIEMPTMYVMNVENRQVYNQGLPASCQTTVETGHTVSIHGRLVVEKDGSLHVSGLGCSVS